MFPVEEMSAVTECKPSPPKNGAQIQRQFLRLLRFRPSHFSRYQFYLPFLISIPCQFQPKIQFQFPFPKLEMTPIPIPNSCDPVNSQFQQKSNT